MEDSPLTFTGPAIAIGNPQPAAPDPAQQLQSAVAYGATVNPDEYAKLLELKKKTGIPPVVSKGNEAQVQQAADVQSIDYQKFVAHSPRTAAWGSDPENAAVSGVSDLQNLSAIEQQRNQALRVSGLTPSQQQAVIDERARISGQGNFKSQGLLDSAWSEGKSLLGNIYSGAANMVLPFVDAAGALAQKTLASPGPLMNALTGLDDGQGLRDVWTDPRELAVQKYVTNPVRNWVNAPIKSGPQQYLQDANGAAFENPDYHWYNPRAVVNAVSQAPGALAAMLATGGLSAIAAKGAGITAEAAGVEGIAGATAPSIEAKAIPALLSSQSAQSTYADARSKGADQQTAILAALEAGFSNYGLMAGMPGGVPAGSLRGAAGQWAARSVGMGTTMALSDNAIARGYDPNRGLLEGLPASIAQMGAFEGVGSLSNISDLVEASKLRTRAPEKFQEALQATFGHDPSLRIPVTEFNSYFEGQKMDPAAVAAHLESTNYAEAHLSGGYVEVPTENFLGKLDLEQRQALLPHIVDPVKGRTIAQDAQYQKELADFQSGDGPQKLVADLQAADAESKASPEFEGVKEDLLKRYIDAGETPAKAETTASAAAADIANLANAFQLKPTEALAMFNPKVVRGEAPEAGNDMSTRVITPERIPPPPNAETSEPIEFKAPEGETPKTIAGHDGKTTTLLTSARELPANYRLVEADSLIPSHDAHTFAKNPAYPEGLQERAYDTSKEAQARVIQQAQNYDPRYTVNTNPDAVNGPPVVTPDGTVLGGNSRTMSTQRLYEKDGSAYKAALKEQAATYGFTPEQVEGMKKPVLVRQIDTPATPDDARRLGSELNKSMTGAMGVSERAVSAGKNLKPETLQNVAGMMQADDSTLREAMGKHGSEIVKMLTADGVITDRERPQFVDAATGGLSEEGKTFVERALMGSVIDDPRLMDSAPKSVLNKLERSLGSIASFASRPDKWNLLPAIREAVQALGAIQRAGSTVDLRLGQTSMFDGERNPLVDAMIRALDGKPNDVRKAFDDYAHDSDANLPGQGRMFGEANAYDAFNHAFGSTLSEQEYHDGLEAAATKAPDTSASADAQSNEGISGGFNRVPSPGSQESASLNQSSDAGEPRGWLRILPDGSVEVGKTEIGNESTDLHELLGHGYLIALDRLFKAHGDLASDTIKADRQTILDFLGAKDLDSLTREQHERFADATLQYLREGKVPNPGLREAFQRIAVWLQSIFKKASDLGVEISPELRGVMDRRFAAEDGVNRAETEAGPRLFNSPEEAGWTQEQFDRYAADNNLSVEQAKSHILGMINEAAIRDRSQNWRDEENTARQAATEQLDARPEYMAIRGLRKGALDDGTELTMGRDDLVKQFGEERVKALQRAHPGLYRNEGGEDPEVVAETFGYQSAEEMMRAIEAAPRRSSAIETATRDYMTAKHGDIRYDGTLDDQARIALENDTRAEGLHAELTALKQKVAGMSGQRDALRSIEVAPIASYREAAHQMVESKAVADLNPTRYLDASRKYSREAFDAVRAGDAQKAADAIHKELMNHFLFREATKAKEYIGKFESYVKRSQKTAAQSKLGLAGSDYRDQFNRILGRYGLGPQVGPADRTLGEWAKAQYDQGKEPAIAPSILDESRAINYRSAPVSEIRQVHDALVNIRKLASLELGMEVNGKRIEFATAVAAMESQARGVLPNKPVRVLKGNTTLGEKTTDYAQRGNALLMRTEFLMNRLDGGAQGPWHDYLWHLASDAQGNEYKLQEEVTKRIGDALAKMPKEQRLGMLNKVTVNGIPETVTRHDLVSMAMNMGNDGNFDRLQKTFISHGWDPNAIETVARTLTREEWQFVQDTWDSLKPLGQAQSDLERRLTGLPPLMVTPAPLHLDLADGSTMDLVGGYFPIVMDPRYSKRGAEQDAGTTAQNLMEGGYGRAATSRGNMQARTGFGGPLQLDYEQVLTQHTAKVIKDITHREFMLAANKLLLDPQLRLTIRETLGDGYEEKMMPWLRTIINDRNGSTVQGLGDGSRVMRSLRTNIVKAALTFKVSTVLLQVTHASSMFNYTSPGSYAQAMVDFMAHPKDMSEEIRNLSPNEMSSRGENIDRDLRALIQTETGKRGVGHALARAGMAPVQFMDHMMSFPLWLSVYRDGLQEGVNLPEKDAQYQAMQKADAAVRMGLGSNAPKDLPPIMRNNDFTKLITTLGGFHNLKWNQISQEVHDVRNGPGSIASRSAKFTYGMLMAAVIPPILGQLVTGHGPKDDENAGLWAAKKALLFPVETLPLFGNVLQGIEQRGETSFSPLQGMAERAAKAGAHATSDNDEKDWTGIEMDGLQSAMDAFGVVGTDQAFKTARYARQASKGNIENPNVWDAVAGSAHK